MTSFVQLSDVSLTVSEPPRLGAVEASASRAEAITRPLAGSSSQNEAMRRELVDAWSALASDANRYAAGAGAKRTSTSADFLQVAVDAEQGVRSLEGKPAWSELHARNQKVAAAVSRAAGLVRSKTYAELLNAQTLLRTQAALLSLVPSQVDPTGQRGVLAAASALIDRWKAVQSDLERAHAADEVAQEDAARIAAGQREVRAMIEAKVSEVSGAFSNFAESLCTRASDAGVGCEPGTGRRAAAWLSERRWWFAGAAALAGGWFLLGRRGGTRRNGLG